MSNLWPDGKRFAFTVFDDTDLSTMENVPPVYALLRDLGLRTTKSVWPLRGTRSGDAEGAVCEDQPYLAWVQSLQGDGFEIGYHMATYHTSQRESTIKALDGFEELFGAPPLTMANHAGCEENIYWGPARLTGVNRLLYNAITIGRYRNRFRGHVQGDPLFWGDICRDKIQYVRNFIFPSINTLGQCPFMPYHDTQRPYVNYWFASSEGPDVDSFNTLLREENQDRLEREGGACIVYTHFGAGFWQHGSLNRRFRELTQRLARKNGWFVPVATLLGWLLAQRGRVVITAKQRNRLERAWLSFKLRRGTS